MTVVDKLSFAAGEISPALRARRDIARQQAGVKRAENLVVLLEGGLTRSPGTRFIAPYKDETNPAAFVPFQYTSSDAYILVFNGGAVRFLRNGGVLLDGMVPYEITQPYAPADLINLRWASVGNEIFLTCVGTPPRVITRSGALSWSLDFYRPTDGPLDVQNLDTGFTLQASGVIGSIAITANTNRFNPSDVGRVFRLDEADLSVVPQWTASEAITAGDQRRNAGNVYEAQNTASAGVNPPTHTAGTVSSGTATVVWKYLHSGFGFVIITSVSGPSSAVATATVTSQLPDSVTTVATWRWFPGAWSDENGWPEVVIFDRNKLLFLRGSKFWETVPNDFYSFAQTDDDFSALAEQLVPSDGSLAELRFALSAGVLMIGAARQEWSIRGGATFDAPTVTNINPVVESGEGAASAIPALVDTGAVFIGASRRRLHVARFDALATAVAVDELTLSARHILKGRAKRLAYQRDPNRVLWVACQNGDLRAVTLLDTEKTVGWSRRPMVNGLVEEIASLSAADESRTDVYLGVQRTINGHVRRYIEIMAPYFEPEDEDVPTVEGAWFVDCGLEYTGAPATILSGLEHLEGQSVRAFADGVDRGLFTVTGGAITLNQAAAEIVVGIPQVWRVVPLPFELDTAAGSSVGKVKRANIVHVQISESAGGVMSSNGGEDEPIFASGALPYGSPIPAFTGSIEMAPLSPTGSEAVLTLTGDNAYPFTLCALSPDVDLVQPQQG